MISDTVITCDQVTGSYICSVCNVHTMISDPVISSSINQLDENPTRGPHIVANQQQHPDHM